MYIIAKITLLGADILRCHSYNLYTV